MRNLAYTTASVSMKIPFVSLLLSWVEGLLVLGRYPSLYITLRIIHVSHAFQGSGKQILFPFFSCSLGFCPKDLCSQLLQWNLWQMASGARGGVMVKALHYTPAGLLPDGVNGIFQWHNPSSRTMALGSTQPLTEMSIRCISWG